MGRGKEKGNKGKTKKWGERGKEKMRKEIFFVIF